VSVMHPVLVTGAAGTVGRYTVAALVEGGHHVVATDVRTPATEGVLTSLPEGAEQAWVDLRDPGEVDALLQRVRPSAVVHLAALIPPGIYAAPALGRQVNVDGTSHLVRAVERLAREGEVCRFVHTSSVGVHGSRNPHTQGVLDAGTPVRPRDVYGVTKAEAERVVRASALEWVICRLGAVMYPDMVSGGGASSDSLFFQAILPSDGRLQTVDVRDVAGALMAATTADCVGRTLLIGGDDSHRMTQGELLTALGAALGIPGAMSAGRPGDPGDDDAWFCTDWMDTTEAQELLRFQTRTWDDVRCDLAGHAGLRRYLLWPTIPAVRVVTMLLSPLRRFDGPYSPMWRAVEARWGPEALAPGDS
jgi:D-erythronate 2-dehydrogenase